MRRSGRWELGPAVMVDGSGRGTTTARGPSALFPIGRSVIGLATTTLWVVLVVGGLAGLGAAWFAGWRLEVVRTGSMAPAIPRGSLAIVSPISPYELQEGDVVAFRDPADGRRRLLHRAVAVIDRRGSGGGSFLRTQGDANATADPLLVPAHRVLGRMRWHVPRLGDVMWMLRPPFGFVLFVGAPVASMGLGHVAARGRWPAGTRSARCPACGRRTRSGSASSRTSTPVQSVRVRIRRTLSPV